MDWYPKSVKGQFITAIAVISITSMALLFFWNYQQTSKTLFEEQNREIDGLVHRLKTSLSNAVWEYNQTQVQKTVDAELGAPYIVGIEVYDERKLLYAVPVNVTEDPSTLKDFRISEPGSDSIKIELVHEKYANDRPIGFVRIHLSDAHVKSKLKDQTSVLIFQMALSVLAIVCVTYIVLILIVIRPLNKVQNALEQVTVDSADLSTRLAEDPMVEFRGITLEFNRFVAKVQRVLGASIDDVHSSIRDVSEGDLSKEIPVSKGDENSIMSRLKTMQDSLRQMQSLVLAKEAADSANRAKSEFISNMNHEMRNPLTAIIGMTDLLEDSSLSDEQKEFLVILRKSSHHLLGLVNDILDYSKLENNSLILEHVTFQIEDVVRDALDVLREPIIEKGIMLSTQISPEVGVLLQGDPLRIRQILINYLDNAIKFSPKGAITIRVSMPWQTQNTGSLRIEVEDNGKGIAPDRVKYMFNRFSQEDSSTTRRYGGTGLGLAICQRLATLMDGTVGVKSTVGVGSCVWCELSVGIDRNIKVPITPTTASDYDELPDFEMVPESPPPILADKRILLVEDVSVNRKIVVAMLKDAKVEVLTAADGMLAVEMVNNQRRLGKPFDLVLMDLHMPNMDGFSATEEIMINKENAGLRIIAMTADSTVEARKLVMEKGACDFLAKPFERTKLWSILARHSKLSVR